MSLDLAAVMITSTLASSAWEVIRNYQEAKKKHEDRSEPRSAEGKELETKRQELLARICNLQYDIVVVLSDHTITNNTLPVLLDQASHIYQAASLPELRPAQVALDHIDATIERSKCILRQRARERSLAVKATVVALVAMGVLVFWGGRGGPSSESVLPILELPLPILLWAAIGSFVSMLYRFNSASRDELPDPVRWLITRPVVGVAMGMISYFVIKVGLLSLGSDAQATMGQVEVVWLVAFLAGFSDRFAEGLLRSLVGKFGGDPGDSLLLETGDQPSSSKAITGAFGALRAWTEKQKLHIGKPKESPPGQPDTHEEESRLALVRTVAEKSEENDADVAQRHGTSTPDVAKSPAYPRE